MTLLTKDSYSTAKLVQAGSPLKSIDDALNAIFGSSAQETLLEKSRRIMGDEAAELSDEELEYRMTELQHLIDYWMDVYEKQLFEGKTLQQVLMEG